MAKVTIDGHEYGSGKVDDSDRIVFKTDKNNQRPNIFDDKDLMKNIRSAGLFEPSDMKYRRVFYPFKRIDPHNRVQGTKEYVFFTKPRIPIIISGSLPDDSQFAKIPYFKNLYDRGYKEILQDLSGSGSGDPSPFIKILTNRISSNIDIPGLQVDIMETAHNLWGTKITYPKTSMSSDENMEFTCEFEETKYLEIYHLFKAWDLYRQMKWWGIISPPDYCIQYKILNDHIAVYKFIVGEDGETLLYWCKWTGVFPSSIGRDTFSEIPNEGPLKITVTFKVSGWFEDMEPSILSDFNSLIDNNDKGNRNPWTIWDYTIGGISQENMNTPYLIQGKENLAGYRPVYFEWCSG